MLYEFWWTSLNVCPVLSLVFSTLPNIFFIQATILVIDSNKFIQILSIWHMNQLVRFSLRLDLSLFHDSIPFVLANNFFLMNLQIMPNKLQLDKFL